MSFCLIHQFLTPITNGFFVLFAAFIFATEHRRQTVTVSLITALIVYAMMWLVQAAYVAVLFLARRRDPLLSDHVMTVRDDGVLDVTKFGEWHIFWRGVQRIAVRPGFVAIYIGSALAFLIPKRAFTSHEAETTFISVLKTRLDEARSASANRSSS